MQQIYPLCFHHVISLVGDESHILSTTKPFDVHEHAARGDRVMIVVSVTLKGEMILNATQGDKKPHSTPDVRESITSTDDALLYVSLFKKERFISSMKHLEARGY